MQTSQLSWFGCETHGFKAILTVSQSTANFSLSFTGTHSFRCLINNFTTRFNFVSIVILCNFIYLHTVYVQVLYSHFYFVKNYSSVKKFHVVAVYSNILGPFLGMPVEGKIYDQWLKKVERSDNVYIITGYSYNNVPQQ